MYCAQCAIFAMKKPADERGFCGAWAGLSRSGDLAEFALQANNIFEFLDELQITRHFDKSAVPKG